MSNKPFYLWTLFFILALGFILRITGIEWGLPTKTETLHTFYPDETIILTALSEMNPSSLDFNPHHFRNGTSHFYISAAVLGVCSAFKVLRLSPEKDFYRNNFREMDKIFLAGRVVSIVFALFTIFIIFFIGKELFGPAAGLLAALIVAIMPVHVIDSHFMYFDVPAAFWFTLALFFSTKIYSEPKMKWYILSAAAGAMACGAKYYGGIALLFPLYAHMTGGSMEEKRSVIDRRILCAVVAFFAIFFATNPYLILAYREAAVQIKEMLGLASTTGMSPDTIKGNSFLFFYPVLMTFAMGIPLAVASWAGFFFQFAKLNKKTSILSFAFLSFYIPMSLFYTKMENYLLPVLPILALFAALLFISLKHWSWKILTALVIVYTFFYSAGYVYIMAKRDTRIQATEWIRQNIPAGTKIGAISFYFYTPPALYSYMHLMPENKNAVDYNTVLTDYDILKLQKERPSYFVITDFEYSEDYQAFWKKGDVKSKELFLDFLMKKGMYENIKTFVEYPEIFGLKLDTRRPPWHMRYVKPEIKIYRLRTD